jgi:hypothetical protein
MADVTRESSKEDWLVSAAQDATFRAAQAKYLKRLERWMLLLAVAGLASFAAGFMLWTRAADHDGWLLAGVGFLTMTVGLSSSSECRLRLQLLAFVQSLGRG